MQAARGAQRPGGRVVCGALLLQRVDCEQRQMLAGSLPIGQQIVPMQLEPLADKPPRSGRQVSPEFASVDVYRHLAAGVCRVEMRSPVLGEVHINRNSEERGDSRHGTGNGNNRTA